MITPASVKLTFLNKRILLKEYAFSKAFQRFICDAFLRALLIGPTAQSVTEAAVSVVELIVNRPLDCRHTSVDCHSFVHDASTEMVSVS